jgi:hypothetical protein
MLTTEAAGLVIKMTKGMLKLTRRIDLVLVEKEATEGPMALPVPDLKLSPTQPQMRSALRRLLKQTEEKENDPIAADRSKIENLLEGTPTAAQLFPFVKKYLPELAIRRILSLNSAFMKALSQARPDWAADPELAVAAFCVSAGNDFRNKSYTWRLALTVVDELAEFGAENTALFMRDEKLQGIVSAVLERFAGADVQVTDSTKDLLRAILKATLNGVFEAKDQLDIDNEWVEGLLNAVADARAQSADPDNFLVGLFQGKGYPLLVGAVMETASGRLAADDAKGFEQAATMFLKDVAKIVGQQPSFKNFFNDHWGDLTRAALKSVEKHGPALLADEEPLLGKILSAVAVDLASRPDNKLLTREALVGVIDAVVGTVASNPDRIEHILSDDWLSTLVKSVADTMADAGIRKSITREGLEQMLKGVLQTFGEQPQLIIDDPGLARDLLGSILKSVSGINPFNAESLGSVIVAEALGAVSKHPELLKFDYAELVTGLVGKVAVLVKNQKLTGIQGQDLIKAAIASLTENPQFLLDAEDKLVETVIDVVLKVSGNSQGGLIVDGILVDVAKQVIGAITITGKAALKNHPIAAFADTLAELLQAGLIRAQTELGNRITLSTVPVVLGQLVAAWAQGKIGAVDPGNDNFKRLFAEIADRAQGAIT